MKKILFLIFVFIINIMNVYANKEEVILNKCVDGDTARFIIGGEDIKVRFLSIDAPEIEKEDKEADPYGMESSVYTCEKLTNANKIYLEYDEAADREDKYGRLLAWVWVDDSLLQANLIENGLAKVRYTYDKYKYNDLLLQKENKAKEEKINIWSGYVPVIYTVIFINDGIEKKILVEENGRVESYLPQKNGYKFVGWMLNNQPFDFNNRINSDIILEAKYEKEFNLNIYLIAGGILLVVYLFSMVAIRRKKK